MRTAACRGASELWAPAVSTTARGYHGRSRETGRLPSNELLQGVRRIDGRHEAVDGVWCQPVEVEVAGLPLNITACDQRRTSGKREYLCLGETGDDRGDLLLRRAEHLRWAAGYVSERSKRVFAAWNNARIPAHGQTPLSCGFPNLVAPEVIVP